MWCASCNTDVAGELSPDAKSLLCTTCGSEVSSMKSSGGLPETRGARELLDRWNTEEILDPYQPGGRQRSLDDDADIELGVPSSSSSIESSASPASTETREEASEANALEPQTLKGPQRRTNKSKSPMTKSPIVSTDEATSSESAAREPVEEGSSETASPPRESRVARRPSQRKFRVDSQHESHSSESGNVPQRHEPRDVAGRFPGRVDASHTSAPTPHFNIAAAFDETKKPGRGESLWGQLLAYAGVGVLTVGTGLVVWGYFGGPDSYTPTGWLLATAGQMLLFLGVVTLISGGMEQTTHEVSQRIERIGETIIRIERHTMEQTLRGPHFSTSEVEAGAEQRAESYAASESS